MDEPHDTDEGVAGDEDQLSPEQAAHLIDQTNRDARRQLGLWQSPWLALFGAAIWLFLYGTLWFSVRDQHPYKGPTGWALVTVYSTIAVAAIAGSVVTRPRRTRQGVSGRTRRREGYLGAVLGAT